jgi:hypothetical protein
MKSRLVCLAALGALSLCGDSFSDLQRSCFQRANFASGKHWLEECLQELFAAQPFHLTVNTIAPGAGIAAFGGAFSLIQRFDGFEFMPSALGLVSTDGSFLAQTQLTFVLPTRGLRDVAKTFESTRQKRDLSRSGVIPDSFEADAKASITFRIQRFQAREQAFYGLGPSTSLSGLAGYGLRQNDATLLISNPLFSWSSVGFSVDFLQPRIDSSSDHSIPQMRVAYANSSIPGLNTRNDYLVYKPYLQVRYPPRTSIYSDITAEYALYHAWDGPRYSFQRVSVTSRMVIPLRMPSHRTPSFAVSVETKKVVPARSCGWSAFTNALCPNQRSGTHCSMGSLTFVGLVSTSYTWGKSQVPFYFDETLGGADIQGNDTLRGFADYRFRAPNRELLQAEYRHTLWGPFGLLSFYDTGKVALQPSDLGFSSLRHDVGLGVYVAAGRRELMRVYIGFGTGEPSHLHSRFGNVF